MARQFGLAEGTVRVIGPRYLERWDTARRAEFFGKGGRLNHCRRKVRLAVVAAVNGNIQALPRRGRGYQDLHYLPRQPRRLAVTQTEFLVPRKAA